ncbi:unnamed protein product [Choristocarpus tenellus]
MYYQGADSVTACVCSKGYYDTFGGIGPEGPSCAACPNGSSGWMWGAIDVSLCICSPGLYLSETQEECVECPAGTYKEFPGNYEAACEACPPGMYSTSTGATNYGSCQVSPTP